METQNTDLGPNPAAKNWKNKVRSSMLSIFSKLNHIQMAVKYKLGACQTNMF